MTFNKEELDKILDLITSCEDIEDDILINIASKVKLYLIYSEKEEEFLKFRDEYIEKIKNLQEIKN